MSTDTPPSTVLLHPAQHGLTVGRIFFEQFRPLPSQPTVVLSGQPVRLRDGSVHTFIGRGANRGEILLAPADPDAAYDAIQALDQKRNHWPPETP